VRRFFQEYFRYPLARGVFKDAKLFPFHRPEALVEDTDLFVQQILGTRRAFLETLLSSPRGFVRADTAGSYGVTTPSKAPALMDLPAGQRAGLLTQPSFLVAFSEAEHPHPISRGKLVSDDLLCQNLVFPMGDVPPLSLAEDATVRERLAIHSSLPGCAACHKFLDPVGLALEQYDHTGRFRTKAEGGKTVDPSGVLAGAGSSDGPFSGPVQLMARLASSPVVRACLVRRAFRYWMGREERDQDACTLAAAEDAYVKSQGDALALVSALLTSDSFLYRAP
jgi:hypothetical protein